MDYASIKSVSLAYADRPDDSEVLANYDNMLRLVESRINRHLKTDDLTVRTTLVMDETKRYYALPDDYNGLRDMKFVATNNDNNVCTFHQASLESISLSRQHATDQVFYAIVANQLFINPVQTNEHRLEILYYIKVPPLLDAVDHDENWLSQDNPDCYINGICHEIAIFAKDGDAASFWKEKMDESLSEIKTDDKQKLYSGPRLITRVVA